MPPLPRTLPLHASLSFLLGPAVCRILYTPLLISVVGRTISVGELYYQPYLAGQSIAGFAGAAHSSRADGNNAWNVSLFCGSVSLACQLFFNRSAPSVPSGSSVTLIRWIALMGYLASASVSCGVKANQLLALFVVLLDYVN